MLPHSPTEKGLFLHLSRWGAVNQTPCGFLSKGKIQNVCLSRT